MLLPAAFVLSGALIGRWWAPLPSVAVVIALSVAELADVGRSGTAVELHAGGFDAGFLLLTSAIAGTLAGTGAMLRWGVGARLARLRGALAAGWPVGVAAALPWGAMFVIGRLTTNSGPPDSWLSWSARWRRSSGSRPSCRRCEPAA